jgi:hypothetical protein
LLSEPWAPKLSRHIDEITESAARVKSRLVGAGIWDG